MTSFVDRADGEPLDQQTAAESVLIILIFGALSGRFEVRTFKVRDFTEKSGSIFSPFLSVEPVVGSLSGWWL